MYAQVTSAVKILHKILSHPFIDGFLNIVRIYVWSDISFGLGLWTNIGANVRLTVSYEMA